MIKRTSFKKQYLQFPPVGYTKVEYLETSGTQKILLDTIEWGYNGRIETDLMWTNLSASGYQLPFFFAGGSKTSYINPDEAPDESDLVWRRWGIIGNLRWDYGADGKEEKTMYGVGSIKQNVRYNIVKDGEKNYLDGRLVCSNGEATWNWKFYTKPKISSDESSYRFYGRYYYLLAIQDNKLRVNLIPTISSTGAPCMFDLVTRQPYYNSGTGDDFLYPTPLTTYSLRRPQAEYAKMTERGIQKLYHLPSDYKGTFEDYITQNNFKKIIETECPNEEGKYYGSRWVETDTELIVEWFEIDPPQEEFFEETLDNSQIS